jgi:hypothetical protein
MFPFLNPRSTADRLGQAAGLRNDAALASKKLLSRISKILCGDETNEEAAFWAQKGASKVSSDAFYAVF